MRGTRVALLAAALTLTGGSAAQAHRYDADSSKLRRAVTVDRMLEHERALQRIADMNGGNRHTETPGYTASVAYVRERMRRAGVKVEVVQFNMPEWEETAPPVFQQLSPTAKTYTPGTEADDNSPSVDYITFGYSPTAEVPSAPVVPTTTS